MSFVTILTPLFNGIEYFEECYNSVIQQTEESWIWIIGVNGHGDENNTVYSRVKEKSDPRILVKNYNTDGTTDINLVESITSIASAVDGGSA